MGYCLWEPKRLKNMEQDCQRLKQAKGIERPMKYMKYRSKRHHVICDYSHRLPKLHCPWDDDAKKKRNEISPGKLYHGLHSTDVTERLSTKPPVHASIDAPIEYHGRQAQDVTAMFTYASRGKRPPSQDYYHGREATDISKFLRIIPPVAKPGNAATEFFGRPKSDVTNYDLFPTRIPETDPRFEALRPLGRCPPGPMCDFQPLIRSKEGKLLLLQPEQPPSPVCSSGTHKLPLSTTLPVRRHHQELPQGQEQQFVPSAGGILAQVVPGTSRSEAKRPVGHGVPGVMANYIQLERDETGQVTNEPNILHWEPPRTRSPCNSPPSSCINEEHHHEKCPGNNILQNANRDEMKKPLGRAPLGAMHDFVPNPPRNKHRHTSLGYWAIPIAYPLTPPKPEPLAPRDQQQDNNKSIGPGSNTPSSMGLSSCKTHKTLKGAKKKLKRDRRQNMVCQMHQPDCPYAAEQGHIGPCIQHPAVASYVKWPKDGDIEVTPCRKHGGRSGIFTIHGSPCSFVAASQTVGPSEAAARANGDDLDNQPGEPGIGAIGLTPSNMIGSRPRSPKGIMGIAESRANQSPLQPDIACPRAPCECIRVANKGIGFPMFGYVESVSRLDSKFKKDKKSKPISVALAAAAVAAMAKRAKNKKLHPKKSMAFVTEETSPQHFRVPYFGLAPTYVTNPAISPNLTPPLQRLQQGGIQGSEEKNESKSMEHRGGILMGAGESLIPTDTTTDEMLKSCSQADICRHHHDGKSPWFGKSKTFVTDPAVSPNLTPPCFQRNYLK